MFKKQTKIFYFLLSNVISGTDLLESQGTFENLLWILADALFCAINHKNHIITFLRLCYYNYPTSFKAGNSFYYAASLFFFTPVSSLTWNVLL